MSVPLRLILGSLVLGAVGCTTEVMAPPERLNCGPSVGADQDAIREAALRHLFQLNADVEPTADRFLLSYFVGVVVHHEPGDYPFAVDPSSRLLARFSKNQVVVKPVSEAPTRDSDGWPRSGYWEHVFTVADTCWKGPDEVEVQAQKRPRFPMDSFHLITLRKDGTEWVVTSSRYAGGR
jgi:hypothetical protein